MANENFVTYTEVDPNSGVTVITPKVTFTGLSNYQGETYVYKDKGVNYFDGSFIHLLAINITSMSSANGGATVILWALTNDLDDFKGLYGANKDGLFLYFSHSFSPNQKKISLYESNAGTLYKSDDFIISLDTTYYLKIVRDESVGTYGTLYCYIYSDDTRATLLTTRSVALHTSKKDYRYVMPCMSEDQTAGSHATVTGYTKDLELYKSSIDAPTVITQPVSDVTGTTATGNGNVTDLGDADVTQHGVCWNTGGTPTTSDSKTEEGAKAATGGFTSSITGLTAGTLYYVRAYAINSLGTSYGAEVSFIASAPTVETLPVIGEGGTSATGQGNVTGLGGTAVTAHGVCWVDEATYDGGSHPPTTSDDHTDEGAKSATGIFETPITELTAGVLYYVRAYATNSSGTSYGATVSFASVAGGAKGNYAIVENRWHWAGGVDGKERYVEGTLV